MFPAGFKRWKIKWMTSPSYVAYRGALKKLRARFLRGRWECWICSGLERQGGQPLKFAYAGSKQNKNYLARMILSDGAEHRSLGRATPRRCLEKAARQDCDLAVFEIHGKNKAFLKETTYFRIPVWIPLRLKMEGDLAALHKRKSLSNLRWLCRKNPLRYEATTDEKKLLEFYTNLYAPFVAAAHDDEVLVHPYHEILKRFRAGGELLMAFDEKGEWVGGNVIEYSAGEGRSSFIGVRGDLARTGALGAIMFQAMARIKEKGFGMANLGDSHGFLKDGVLRFKARLGAGVLPRDEQLGHFWTLKLLKKPSTALKAFFSAHPFISIDENAAPWAVFFTEDRQSAEFAEMLKDSLCEGLAGMRIHDLSAALPIQADVPHAAPAALAGTSPVS